MSSPLAASSCSLSRPDSATARCISAWASCRRCASCSLDAAADSASSLASRASCLARSASARRECIAYCDSDSDADADDDTSLSVACPASASASASAPTDSDLDLDGDPWSLPPETEAEETHVTTATPSIASINPAPAPAPRPARIYLSPPVPKEFTPSPAALLPTRRSLISFSAASKAVATAYLSLSRLFVSFCKRAALCLCVSHSSPRDRAWASKLARSDLSSASAARPACRRRRARARSSTCGTPGRGPASFEGARRMASRGTPTTCSSALSAACRRLSDRRSSRRAARAASWCFLSFEFSFRARSASSSRESARTSTTFFEPEGVPAVLGTVDASKVEGSRKSAGSVDGWDALVPPAVRAAFLLI